MSSNNNGPLAIGKGIYLIKPVSSKWEPSVPDPTVILVFGWLGAQVSHLLKYSNVYNEIYPESAKIIIQSEASLFWSSRKTKHARLSPVVEALEMLGCLPPATNPSKLVSEAALEPMIPYPTPRILVHAFSNGGSLQLVALSDVLASRATSSQYPKLVLSPSAVILDSCPGHGGVESTILAFSSAVRNPILRSIIAFFIRLLYLYHSLAIALSGRTVSVLDRLKENLNKENLLPWLGKGTKRLYLYSRRDNIIPPHEIEKHAAHAKEQGLQVTLEPFEESSHVAHAKMYPDRYWDAIKVLWVDANKDDRHPSRD